MAKVGKLTKLKSAAMKRWPSLTKFSRSSSSSSISAVDTGNYSPENNKLISLNDDVELHAVYVGKSRRRYLVNSDVVDHPLFRELVDKSGGGADSDGCVVVSCEVVLFEHLLWMLDNAEAQLGSTDELVDFYTC